MLSAETLTRVRADRRKAYGIAWHKENKTRFRACQAKWRAANPDKYRAALKKWADANKDSRRTYTRTRAARTRGVVGVNLSGAPGICQICFDWTEKLCWDHCHTQNTFRGWLCGKCNAGIGLLGEHKSVLLSALEYLDHV